MDYTYTHDMLVSEVCSLRLLCEEKPLGTLKPLVMQHVEPIFEQCMVDTQLSRSQNTAIISQIGALKHILEQKENIPRVLTGDNRKIAPSIDYQLILDQTSRTLHAAIRTLHALPNSHGAIHRLSKK
jgi:hypothetical protein